MGLGLSSNDSSIAAGPIFTVRGRAYRIMDVVGQGGEATVYRCEDRTGTQHAVKVFYFSRYETFQLPQRVDGFLKEARIMKSLSGRSPHFMKLIDYEYNRGENVGYMIMELGSGSLRQLLRGYPLDASTQRSFWKQIVGILTALEDAHIVHADIKPDNMIMVGDVIKITDLGLAFRLSSPSQNLQRPIVRGTLDYMAPEIFSHRTGFRSDIWSAGIILYEMTFGRPPYFPYFDRDEKIEAIRSNAPIHLPPTSDPHLSDCIRQCLQFDSRLRPTARRLRMHRYSKM